MPTRSLKNLVTIKNEAGLIVKAIPWSKISSGHNWLNKHHPDDKNKFTIWKFGARAKLNAEWARQMQLGLVDADVICVLLWYLGVSKTKDFDQSGHVKKNVTTVVQV